MVTQQECSAFQTSNGECKDTYHDVKSNSAQQPAATPTATRIPSIEQSMLPSVERRRRRVTLQGTNMGDPFSHDKYLNTDFSGYAKFGWFDSSTTITSVLGLVFLIAILHKAGLYKFDRLYSKIFESPTVMAKEIRGDTTSASTTTNYGNDCLPGLENEKTETINPKYHQQNLHSTGTINYDSKELPPAFISENDYPKGWLVYHPEHKVINLEKLLQEISGAEY